MRATPWRVAVTPHDLMHDLMSDLNTLIARELKLAPGAVTDDLAFGEAPGWDSLAHINLMLALEQEYGVRIGDDEMVELTSVSAIRAFIQGSSPDADQ
jgi:acyl carrier protein